MRARHVITAASIVLLAVGLAAAGQGHDGRRGMLGKRLDRIARQLDLTDGQRTRIREVFQQHRGGGLGTVAQQARAARRDLRSLIHDPSADDAVIRDAAARAARTEADLAVARHRAFAEAFSVLTPEQRNKAKAPRASPARRRPTI